MSNPFLVVLKRSYLKLIKSKAFWATTIALPIFVAIVSVVSSASSKTLQDSIDQQTNNAKALYIMDENNYIPQSIYVNNLNRTDNQDFGIQQVKLGNADAFIYYPKNITSSLTIQIYSQDKGIMSLGMYDNFAKNLIKQGVIQSIQDPAKITVLNSVFTVDSHLYKNGESISSGYEVLIIPITSIVIYFLFTSLSTSYLLLSVSEEKENRMIEIILSSIKPRDLILGKIIGQVAAVLTQIVVLLFLIVIVVYTQRASLPFDITKIVVDPVQIVLAVIYLLLGFIILATTMVGVGSAMPTYREATSFASIFIILSIFPIYFFPLILADPSGLIANIVSYFPFTAPMILMLRNALGAITPFEIVLSLLSMIFFIFLFSQIAYKLFEYGSLEYSQKISFKSFLKSLIGNRTKI